MGPKRLCVNCPSAHSWLFGESRLGGLEPNSKASGDPLTGHREVSPHIYHWSLPWGYQSLRLLPRWQSAGPALVAAVCGSCLGGSLRVLAAEGCGLWDGDSTREAPGEGPAGQPPAWQETHSALRLPVPPPVPPPCLRGASGFR